MRSFSECFLYGKTDKAVVLITVRVKEEDKWVCVKCLPRPIHKD